jgi:hypothetical protein
MTDRSAGYHTQEAALAFSAECVVRVALSLYSRRCHAGLVLVDDPGIEPDAALLAGRCRGSTSDIARN